MSTEPNITREQVHLPANSDPVDAFIGGYKNGWHARGLADWPGDDELLRELEAIAGGKAFGVATTYSMEQRESYYQVNDHVRTLLRNIVAQARYRSRGRRRDLTGMR